MSRRLHIIGLVSLLLLLPGAAAAKTLIGVVMTADIPYYRDMHSSFQERLAATMPGKEVEYILQRPFPDPIAWSNAARKLIALDVDLIISYGAPATKAVLFEKSNIPVVYAGVYEPGATDIGGKNVTGCGYRVPLSSLLRYFKRFREIKKVRVVYSSTEEDSVRQMTEIVSLSEEQRVELSRMDIRSHGDLRKFSELESDDGVYLTGSGLAHVWLDDLLSVSRAGKIPVVDIFPDPDEEGVLITLYHPPAEQGGRAADMAARIIGGEKPQDIVPQVMRDTELVINLVEAKRQGIMVPMQLVVEATRVIR
ncbi:MAG: ABC transporter substrate-binding protein [Desulfobulbaceae bacterium]